MKQRGPISQFFLHNFRHFNAASMVDAAKAFEAHIDSGKKMLLAMGGAMSTAEIGITLAEMIRQEKFHAVSCSANNAEEDIFNLVANQLYYRVPGYRNLTPADETALFAKHYNRVTDTCIPEHEAFRRIEAHIVKLWKDADAKGERKFPYEFFYDLLLSGVLEEYYADNGGQGGEVINSWLLAAANKDRESRSQSGPGFPIFLPGWEDSTLGNIFCGYVMRGEVKASTMKSGVEYMQHMAEWYLANCGTEGIGFFQLGGGIAGDFPICVVPMLQQDMEIDVPVWSYFFQCTDTNESYGSYSGAAPREKITWGKLTEETPMFSVNSDATIVAPLIFAYVLNQ